MKRTIAIVIALIMVFCLFAACGEKKAAETKTDTQTQTTQQTTTPSTQTSTDQSGAGPSATGTATTTQTIDLSNVETLHPSDDAVLNIATNQEPEALTQPGHAYSAGMLAAQFFFEQLLKWDSDTNTPSPMLATEWKWVDDLTLELKLRDDVTSIAGDPFTANDVVFTWNLGNETTALAGYYGFFDYENTKAIDDYTVQLALKKPYPFLLIDLTNTAYDIAVQKSYEATADPIEDPKCGTGPYKLVEWHHGVYVEVERRDDYWGDLPYYKYMNFYTVTDSATRVMGVEAGDYEMCTKPTISQALACKGNPDLTVWSVAGPGKCATFVMNSDHEPLNSKEARQAISLAIDYDALVDIACAGEGELTDSLYATFHPYYCAPTPGAPNYIRYDPDLAKQKLQEGGFPNGFTISIKYRTSDDTTVKSAECIQYMLREVGITVELIPQDSAVWYADMRSGDWDTHIAVGGNPNPKRNINTLDGHRITHQANTGTTGQQWQLEVPGGYEYVEGLIDGCMTTIDEAKSREYFQELQDLVREYVPMLVICVPYSLTITTADIINFGRDSMGSELLVSTYTQEYIDG